MTRTPHAKRHSRPELEGRRPSGKLDVGPFGEGIRLVGALSAAAGPAVAQQRAASLLRDGMLSLADGVRASTPVLRRGHNSVQPAQLVARLGAGRALSEAMQSALRARFEEAGVAVDLAAVRVHTDGAADALCRQLGAEAFTFGHHVAFRSGTFRPTSRAGLELLAHELTHVAQVQSGQALEVAGPVSQPGDPVEAAAERTAATVAAAGPLESSMAPENAAPAPDGGQVAPRSAVLRTPTEAAPAAPAVEPGDVVSGWVVYETEARRGGTLAWRNNNPGNIRPGAFATNHGAYAGKRSGGFAVFPTYEQGFAAIKALLRTSRYSPLTISAAIAIYAPSDDSNDPVAYAATISRRTGLDSSRTIDSLNDTELDSVAQAIRAVEGYTVGTTLPRTDTTLPARARLTAPAVAPSAAPAAPVMRTCTAGDTAGVVCDAADSSVPDAADPAAQAAQAPDPQREAPTPARPPVNTAQTAGPVPVPARAQTTAAAPAVATASGYPIELPTLDGETRRTADVRRSPGAADFSAVAPLREFCVQISDLYAQRLSNAPHALDHVDRILRWRGESDARANGLRRGAVTARGNEFRDANRVGADADATARAQVIRTRVLEALQFRWQSGLEQRLTGDSPQFRDFARWWMSEERERMMVYTDLDRSGNAQLLGYGRGRNMQAVPEGERAVLVPIGGEADSPERARIGRRASGSAVSPFTNQVLGELATQLPAGWTATNYPGHGADGFRGRGLSLDIRLGAQDSRGFYSPEAVMRFLGALEAVMQRLGGDWQGCYDDHQVLRQARAQYGRKIVYLHDAQANSHGPLLLHVHIDLYPAGGLAPTAPRDPAAAERPAAGPAAAPPGGPTVARDGGAGGPQHVDARAVQAQLGAGSRLAPEVIGALGPRLAAAGLAVDLNEVRIHTDAAAGALAKELSANAFTVRRDIAFAPGLYDPTSERGQRLLIHELAHVAQAGRGGLSGGGVTSPGDSDERAAEAAATTAGKATATSAASATPAAAPTAAATVARQATSDTPIYRSETEGPYQQTTVDYVARLRATFLAAAGRHNVPVMAVVAAIADEYDVHGTMDVLQDATLSVVDESVFVSDRRRNGLTGGNRATNWFRHDVGPGNINVGTATRMVESGQLQIPGVSPSAPNYSRIVAFLQTDAGAIEAAAATIAEGQALFEAEAPGVFSRVPQERAEAVLMEYYKQGPSYFRRFQAAHQANPNHVPSPGLDGAQYLTNRRRLVDAILGPGIPVPPMLVRPTDSRAA